MHILAIESSTTSAKAMLYNIGTGNITVATKNYQFSNGEIGKQDAKIVFDTTMELGRQLSTGEEVVAIALGCTWHSTMLCDEKMRPQTPLLQWTDVSASKLCELLRRDKEYSIAYYQKTGCMVNVTYPFFKLKLLRETGWDLASYRVADQGTYTMYQLTDKYLVSDVTASGSGLLNTKTRDFDEELNRELGITRHNLPELVGYKAAYPLLAEGAKLLGVKPGIPVMVPLADGIGNHIGSGALTSGIMTLSMGTSAAMRLSTAKPILPQKVSTWCYLTPHGWLSGAAIAGCTNCVDWAKDKLFGPMASYADAELGFYHQSKSPTSKSCEGGRLNLGDPPPVFLPFLFGERCPGWQDERGGGFIDVKSHHTKYDLYHSVLEGILYNLYQCFEALTKENEKPHSIKLSGGIQHSAYWTQMCADIFRQSVELDPATQASLKGGVVVALEHLGMIQDLRDMDFPKGEVIYPNPEMVEKYKERYQRYLYWYERT